MIRFARYLILALLLALAVPALAQQRLQSEVPHDTALPPASMMVVTGCEAKDQDGVALPRAVSTEGDAVRCAASLSGISYMMLVSEDGALTLHQVEDAAHVSGHLGIMSLGVRNDTHTTAFSGTDGDYTPFGLDSTGKLGIRGTFAEDAGHTSGDLGLFSLAVRNDTHTTAFSGTDLDYTPLAVDSTGKLGIRGTFAEDAGHTSGDLGLLHLCVRNDAGTALAGTDLDYIPCSTDSAGRMWTRDGATYAEDAGHVTGDLGSFALAVRNDTHTTALTSTDADYSPLAVDSTGKLGIRGTFAEDAAHTTGDLGLQLLTVRQDTAAALAGTDADYQPLITDNAGRLHVNVGIFPDNEPFNLAQIGGAAFAQGQRTTANSVSMTFSSDHGTLPALAANQSVNVAQINGVTPLMGAGVTGTGSPRMSIATDANVVDTELPAAAALADASANPTAPAVGAHLRAYNGATWDMVRTANAADGVNVAGVMGTGLLAFDNAATVWRRLASAGGDAVARGQVLASSPYLYNGTNSDQQRSGSATTTQPHYAAGLVHRAGGAFTFLTSTSHTTTTTLSAQTVLGGFNNLVITWDVTAAERDSANETYDLYVTCGDGVSTWDVAHFPQIITTGAKRFTAFIHGTLLPQNVTTAVPGVAANDPGTFKTDTSGADQGTRTLAAGVVRHGALGDRCGADIVIAGTIVTGITHSIVFTAKP